MEALLGQHQKLNEKKPQTFAATRKPHRISLIHRGSVVLLGWNQRRCHVVMKQHRARAVPGAALIDAHRDFLAGETR
jgi:hypothetical protein